MGAAGSLRRGGEHDHMNRTEKTETVESLKKDLAKVSAVVLADYRGLNVETVNSLRREFEKESIQYRVVKNTMLRLAIEGTPLAGLKGYLEGPTAVAWSNEDPVAPARIAAKFAKENEKFQLKAGYVDGQALSPEAVKQLATMPGKNDLRAGVLGMFAAVPQQFVTVLAALPRDFLLTLAAREEQLKKAG
jgi:large subunit ribosomal protein L10